MLSGFIAAMVFGVISENIKITIVRIIDPNNTLPPKCSIIIKVTIAEANIFAKLFPTKMADRSWSGFLRSSSALFALFFDFFDKFFNLILFAAIMPVSEPENNPLNINKKINIETKNIKETSSGITVLQDMNSNNKQLKPPT